MCSTNDLQENRENIQRLKIFCVTKVLQGTYVLLVQTCTSFPKPPRERQTGELCQPKLKGNSILLVNHQSLCPLTTFFHIFTVSLPFICQAAFMLMPDEYRKIYNDVSDSHQAWSNFSLCNHIHAEPPFRCPKVPDYMGKPHVCILFAHCPFSQ